MRQVAVDGDGRMILPEDLMAFAGITDSAVFVGLGRTFQIWEASALDAYMIEAEALAEENVTMLPKIGGARTAEPPAAPE
jgi:MraZ protein